MWKSSKEYTAFLFMGYALWEEITLKAEYYWNQRLKMLSKDNNGQFASYNRSYNEGMTFQRT